MFANVWTDEHGQQAVKCQRKWITCRLFRKSGRDGKRGKSEYSVSFKYFSWPKLSIFTYATPTFTCCFLRCLLRFRNFYEERLWGCKIEITNIYCLHTSSYITIPPNFMMIPCSWRFHKNLKSESPPKHLEITISRLFTNPKVTYFIKNV